MKKIIITIIPLLLLTSFVSADTVDDAISWMYENKLTIHNNKTDFNADRGLRRDEAAKFYVNFAKQLGKTSYVKTASQCVFSDINDSRSDLKTVVIESCRLGLFQGNKGKFMPKDQLTNAQAITVLVRLLDGNQNEVGLSHRSNNYYSKANQLWVLANVSMNNKNSIASRGNVGVVIYNGNKGMLTTVNNISFFLTNHPNDFDTNNIDQYFVAVTKPSSKQPISSIEDKIFYSLEKLFAIKTFELGESGYWNYLYASNLTIKNVLNENWKFIINIEWTLMGIGSLADMFIKPQITKTIEQYTKNYTIKLNGSEDDRYCSLKTNDSC
jgi:hypothetical protein